MVDQPLCVVSATGGWLSCWANSDLKQTIALVGQRRKVSALNKSSVQNKLSSDKPAITVLSTKC